MLGGERPAHHAGDNTGRRPNEQASQRNLRSQDWPSPAEQHKHATDQQQCDGEVNGGGMEDALEDPETCGERLWNCRWSFHGGIGDVGIGGGHLGVGWPRGPLSDPGTHQCQLRRREGLVVCHRRHQLVLAVGRHVVRVQAAQFRVTSFDIVANRFGIIDAEVGFGLFGAVAFQAMVAKDGGDVA